MLTNGIPRKVVADIGIDIIAAIRTHYPAVKMDEGMSQAAMSAFIYAVALIVRTAHEPPIGDAEWWIEGLREAYDRILQEEWRAGAN